MRPYVLRNKLSPRASFMFTRGSFIRHSWLIWISSVVFKVLCTQQMHIGRIQSVHFDGICLPNNFHYRKWQTFKIFRLMVRMFRNRQYTLITNKLWPRVEQYRGIWTAAEILMYFVEKKQNKTKIVMFWIIDNIYDHMVRDQILPLVCVPKIPVKPAATLAFLVALYCEGKCGMKGKAHRL